MNTEEAWRALLRMEVGKKATLAPVATTNLTPMSLVIHAGLNQAKRPVTVWWADDAPPIMFCLKDEESAAILFSTRSLELDAQARWLVGNPPIQDRVNELAYRLALRRLSENLIALGSHRLALSAVLESIREQNLFVTFGQRWQDLEYMKVDEAYMSLWFFGLAHEFGHVLAVSAPGSPRSAGAFDQMVESAIDQVLSDSDWQSGVKEQLEKAALATDSSLSIQRSSLREECLADVGACSLLHETSQKALNLLGHELNFPRFAWEMLAVGVVRNFNDSALAMSRVISGSNGISYTLAALSGMVATNVRLAFRRIYLEHSWSAVESSASVSKYLDTMVANLQDDSRRLEDALGAATRFLLSSTGSDATGLPSWVKPSLRHDHTGKLRSSLTAFVRLARSFETNCAEIHELGSLIDA